MTPSTGRLAGKLAIITGACGGIGRASVAMFIAEGATVMGCDLFEQDSAEARAFADQFQDAEYRQLDVASPASVSGLVDHLRKAWGRLDVLFNNAGTMLGKPLLETSVEEWDRVHDVNARGAFLMIRGCASMMTSQSSSIINMSSLSGEKPRKNMAAYGASKAAIIMLTKIAALELAPIRVNAILPGAVDTPMPRKFIAGLGSTHQDGALANIAAGPVLGRMAHPSEIASVVVFLASDESSYVTGSAIAIDGGSR